ncbi:MAG: YoaK family protein [Actinomycetota bacterium]|nr:YoaK family protein [Actinomycetota bacterium]MDP2287587.1 YoaK family protein [Actinomycetota bacterium]
MVTRVPQATYFTVGLLMLTASTGIIDAASYIALDRVFTGNMTGNVLFIGFGLIGVDGIPFVNNSFALAGFIVGAVLGARTNKRSVRLGFELSGGLVLVVSSLITLAIAIYWHATPGLAGAEQIALTTVLAGLMGAQVASVRPIGNSDITTVVVTSTITNLARDSRLAGHGQPRHIWMRRLAAIASIGIGGALGALMVMHWGGPSCLVLAAVTSAIATTLLILGSRIHGTSNLL